MRNVKPKVKPVKPKEEEKASIKALDYHRQKYEEGKERIELEKKDIEEIYEVKDTMMKRRIMCYKFNSTLTEGVAKRTCQHAFLELDETGSYLTITNRKLVDKTIY